MNLKLGSFCLVFIVFVWENPTFAHALSHLSQEMKISGVPSSLAEQGANLLSTVKFVDPSRLNNASALYYPAYKSVWLSQSLLDPKTNNIKHFENLANDDVGIVVHELWHSYFHGTSKIRDRALENINEIYFQYPRNKREEIQDEAFGLYIQKVISGYLMIKRIQERSTIEVWSRIRVNKTMASSYERIFSENTFGYFQRSSLMKRSLEWSTVPLPQKQKSFILGTLLEGKITGVFEKDFPEKTN